MPTAREALVLAAVAGAFGATSSVFSKFIATDVGNFTTSSCASWIIRAILVTLIIISNVGAWYCFTLAVSTKLPTPIATGLNLGFNFIITALASKMFFAEQLTATWYAGASIIIVGTVLIGSEGERLKASKQR